MTLSDSNLRLHTHIWRQDRLKCLKTTESVLVQIECVTVLWVSCVFKAGMWAALNDGRECWHVAAMRQVQEAQEKQHGFAGSQESSGQGRCLDRVKRFQLDLQTHDSRHELMRAGRQDRCVCVHPRSTADLQPCRGRICAALIRGRVRLTAHGWKPCRCAQNNDKDH